MWSRVLSKMLCHEDFSQNWKIYFFKAVAEDVVSRANNLEQVSSFLFWLLGHFVTDFYAFLTSFFCLDVFYHQDSNLASFSGGFLRNFCGRLRSGLQLWRCRRNLETEVPECGCGYTLHILCLVNDMMLYFLAMIWEVKYINLYIEIKVSWPGALCGRRWRLLPCRLVHEHWHMRAKRGRKF